jgi:hypothetical protein
MNNLELLAQWKKHRNKLPISQDEQLILQGPPQSSALPSSFLAELEVAGSWQGWLEKFKPSADDDGLNYPDVDPLPISLDDGPWEEI